MARIAGLAAGDAGEQVQLAYQLTRDGIARLTGRETERMIEPLQMYAHAPALLAGYGIFEQATAELNRLDKRTQALAELKAATLTRVTTASTWARRSRGSGA